jgi:hypothetical protein
MSNKYLEKIASAVLHKQAGAIGQFLGSAGKGAKVLFSGDKGLKAAGASKSVMNAVKGVNKSGGGILDKGMAKFKASKDVRRATTVGAIGAAGLGGVALGAASTKNND